MKFDYAIHILKYRISRLHFSKNVFHKDDIHEKARIDSKMKELRQAIKILQKEDKK